MEVSFGTEDNGTQYYQINSSKVSNKERVEIKNSILKEVKDKGIYLALIGFKVNGIGSNNPLLLAKDCITPMYKMLYNFNQLNFSYVEEGLYDVIGDTPLILNIDFDSTVVRVSDLVSKLGEEDIKIENGEEEDLVLIQSLHENVSMELILKLVNSGYSRDEQVYTENLEEYYITLSSKHITHRTKFIEDGLRFEVYPRLENFTAIMEEFINRRSSEVKL